ncbi:hypothetical protein Leryth_015206, partial [Lithospermum erythrorhizon]
LHHSIQVLCISIISGCSSSGIIGSKPLQCTPPPKVQARGDNKRNHQQNQLEHATIHVWL